MQFGQVARTRLALQKLVVLLLVFLGPCNLIQAAPLKGFRLAYHDTLRLHVDVDKSMSAPSLFTLDKPNRLVIDFPATEAGLDVRLPPDPLGHVLSVREGQQSDGRLRIVLVLDQAVAPSVQLLERSGENRLLIDLGIAVPEALSGFTLSPGDTPVAPYQAAGSAATPANTAATLPAAAVAQSGQSSTAVLRDVIVAIDPGHGGQDSGAVGRGGTEESAVVLQVAARLYRVLEAQPGVRPVMTRIDDTYLSLGRRPQMARQAGADIFVSIHADAVRRLGPSGSSVYALSLDGASSTMAAWLARSEKENARIHGGDVELGDIDTSLRETVLDIIQDHTLESSIGLGESVLAELQGVGPLHKEHVEQAAFAVLKSPDIPSILVETAFLSNPEEEKKLLKKGFQQKLAEAIGNGIMQWLAVHAPDGTQLARLRDAQ